MQISSGFLPVVVFFVTYKLYDFFIATSALIVVSALELLYNLVQKKQVNRMQMVTFLLLLVFGGATLYFRDTIFLQWKVTIVYWLFAFILIVTQLIGSKPLIQYMLEKDLRLKQSIWLKVNFAWFVFFTSMGGLNLYVFKNYSEDTWVNFKLFGLMGLTIAFVITQGIYLFKHSQPKQTNE